MMCDDYVVFDIETTGLNKDYDYIIEIGALKYKNNIEGKIWNLKKSLKIKFVRKL